MVDMTELLQVLALDVYDPVLELLRRCFKKDRVRLGISSVVQSFARAFVDKRPRKSRHAILEEEVTVAALGSIEPAHLVDFVRSAPAQMRCGFRHVTPAAGTPCLVWEPGHEPDSPPFASPSGEGCAFVGGDKAAVGAGVGGGSGGAGMAGSGASSKEGTDASEMAAHWSMGAGVTIGSVEREMLTSAFLSAYGASAVAAEAASERRTREQIGDSQRAPNGASVTRASASAGAQSQCSDPPKVEGGAQGAGPAPWEYGVVLELERWTRGAGGSGAGPTETVARVGERSGRETRERVIQSWVLCWHGSEATREQQQHASGTRPEAGRSSPTPFSCWKDRFRRRCVCEHVRLCSGVCVCVCVDTPSGNAPDGPCP